MKIYKEFGRNPRVDWTTLIIMSIVITLGLVFTSYTLYNAIVSGSIVDKGVYTSTTFTKLNEKVIEKVIVNFEAREHASVEAREGYTQTNDPSI